MAKLIRIQGIVREASRVRQLLGQGTSQQGHLDLHNEVTSHLQQIQKILHENGATLRQLPAPSQRAYLFLANIDWQRQTVAPGAASTVTAESTLVAWRGASALIDRVQQALARDMSEGDLRTVGESISRTSRQMEGTIERQSLAPERLTPATRIQRGWLAYFSQPGNVQAYVRARQTAGRLVDAAAAGSRHYPPPILIFFRPIKGIFQLRATRREPILSLPTPMVAFDERAFATLASRIFDRSTDARQQMIELMTGEGFQTVRAEMEALGGIVEDTRGAAHDLAASFNRINAAYFGGTMKRPRLTWNRTFTGRKFGHYDFVHDTVMVSRTLDTPQVPEFVVDFLIFHELLHKYHGLHWVNGRGYAHTAEFYASEKKFPRHAEAETILSKLAGQVR